MKIKNLFAIISFLFSCVFLSDHLFAQNKKSLSVAKEEIVIKAQASDQKSIFKLGDSITYLVDMKNTYRNAQNGKLTCAVYDFNNNSLASSVLTVKIEPQSAKQLKFSMPSQKAGFYKIDFMLNVTDDDDTVRHVFGVDTANINLNYQRPKDFAAFWDNAKKELALVAPNYKVTERPDLSSGNDQIYLVEMKSLGNITVRAWLTLPKDRKPGQKLPITLGLPGYGLAIQPRRGITAVAFLGLNVRGLGNSRDVIHPLRDEFITYGIRDKNTYIFKGVLMDCMRAVDFICSRPEIDSHEIFTSGGSMGGYLALALSGLDDRIALCSADNPGYPDQRYVDKLWHSKSFPFNTMKDYARLKNLKYDDLLDVWDYYDLRNFSQDIKCPTVMGMGFIDPFIPPVAEMDVYNSIKSTKKLFVFPDLTHEVGPEMSTYVGKWVYDSFHIYEKWLDSHQPSKFEQTQTFNTKADASDEVIDIKEHPANKWGVFTSDAPVSYTLDLTSSFATKQDGKISYAVFSHQGKLVTQSSMPLSVEAKGTQTVKFDIPAQTAGIYSVQFRINTTGYDDTMRRAFGVDTNKIRGADTKPGDFNRFWATAKEQLAQVAPNFKMTEKPELEKGANEKVYLIEMQSLGNMTIRGYLSLPKDIKAGQKLPVSIYLPGYAAQAVPPQTTQAMAIISISVRGQTLSDDMLKPTREGYISTGIEDKNKYILRGALMDCVRLLDFIDSRPELEPKAIYATGASMGGYLALALSALDSRVTITSANNPVFSDFRSLAVTSHSFPIIEIEDYVKAHNLQMANVLNTLDYFDLKNFSDNIKAPTVVGIGLLDNLAPPTTELEMFNNISGNKKLFVFPNLPHEVGPEIGAYVGKWAYTKLDVYGRWMAFNKASAAAKAKEEENGSESIAIIDHPATKDAIFKANASVEYNLDVRNNFFKEQTGRLSYFVYTSDDKFVLKDSMKVNLDSRAIKQVHISVPSQKAGFYKINFAINVNDYDDTVHRVFGCDIENIHSTYPKPADFDAFWDNTKAELAKVAPDFKMTEMVGEEKEGEQIYLVEMRSLDNIVVRAWLTLPKERRKKEKFPVILQLPSYAASLDPPHGVSDFAVISLNVRGHGNSRDVVHPSREDFISYNVEDKNKYIFRGAIMDGVRMVDFIYAHQDIFDVTSIYVRGSSQGGYLTLALAGVDPRISICAADNPGYIDLQSSYYKDKWPVSLFREYAEDKSIPFQTLMNNIDYFNLKNFAPNIKCKVIMGIGLLDPLVPPTNELIMYNNINTPKKLFIYPKLTHEVAPELGLYMTRWMIDNLGL